MHATYTCETLRVTSDWQLFFSDQTNFAVTGDRSLSINLHYSSVHTDQWKDGSIVVNGLTCGKAEFHSADLDWEQPLLIREKALSSAGRSPSQTL